MSPAALLLLGLLPATVAGSGQPSRLQLDLSPSLLTDGSAPTRLHSASLSLGATLYLRPVTDDATPVALQPYLQRASTVWLRLAGGRRDVINEELTGSLDAGADLYLTSLLALRATVGAAGFLLPGANQNGPHQLAELLPSPLRAAASLGLRLGDLRLDLGYRYQPRADTVPEVLGYHSSPDGASFPGGGALTASVRAVLVERIDLHLDLLAGLAANLQGAFACDYYPSRRLGLLFRIDFGHGARDSYRPTPGLVDPNGTLPDFTSPAYRRFGARFGLSWWWTPRLGLQGGYEFTAYFPLDGGTTNYALQRFSVELSTRL